MDLPQQIPMPKFVKVKRSSAPRKNQNSEPQDDQWNQFSNIAKNGQKNRFSM